VLMLRPLSPFRLLMFAGTASADPPVPAGFERFMVRNADDSGWEPFQVRKADDSGWEDFQVRTNG
jgi:hypothetical protein